MNNPNKDSQKSQLDANANRKSDTSGKSRRIYKSKTVKEPWYLKLIFWLLVIILVGGGGVAGFIMLAKFNRNQEAQYTELKIDRLIVEFQDKILQESDKLDYQKFEDARKLAYEGKEISDEIAYLIDGYLNSFNEKVEGFNRVGDLKAKYESLYKQFIELNEVDPRYHDKKNQTQPKLE